MLKLKEAIVVEGRYDKIALEPLVDTAIFTTDGFGIFHDREKMALLRAVAEARGLIVLTDADGAGLVIRNRLRGSIDGKYLKHAYIPDIPGKERRKELQKRLGLPEKLSANALLEAINCLYTREEFLSAAQALQEEGGEIAAQQHAGGVLL